MGGKDACSTAKLFSSLQPTLLWLYPGREVRYLEEVLLDWDVESRFSNIHDAASGEVLVPGNVAFPNFGSPYQHGAPGV